MPNITSFQQLNSQDIVIFGAGKIAGATIRYLKEQGLSANLLGILDNNQKKNGTIYEGLPVFQPEAFFAAHCSAEPEGSAAHNLAIIIAILDYPQAYQQILALAPDFPKKQIFLSLSWKIPYEDDPAQCGFHDLRYRGRKFADFSSEEIRALLADEDSRQLFDLIRTIRGGHVNLFQYEDLRGINGSSIYWGRDDLKTMAAPGTAPCAILDCGAYTGDSIEEILRQLQPERCSYYAFEPDKTVQSLLTASQQAANDKRLAEGRQPVAFHNIPKGAWCREQRLQFHYYTENAASSLNQNQNLDDGADGSIEVTAIDQLEIAEERVYIKMDIEGSELAALRGAEHLIRQKKPYLAICAYHRPHDLLYLPLMLLTLNPDYRIYLAGGMHYTYYAI